MIAPGDEPPARALPNCKGGVDHAVERERGSIRHHGGDVDEFDALLALGIERELADLVARSEAVAAKQREQSAARIGRKRCVRGAHFLVDQAGEIAFAVGVTGKCRGGFRFFAQRPQRRGLAQFAGLDNDAAFR
jgi:hypothetical protein